MPFIIIIAFLFFAGLAAASYHLVSAVNEWVTSHGFAVKVNGEWNVYAVGWKAIGELEYGILFIGITLGALLTFWISSGFWKQSWKIINSIKEANIKRDKQEIQVQKKTLETDRIELNRKQNAPAETIELANRHGASATPTHESTCACRFPHPIPPPQAGERANESLRDFHGKEEFEACQPYRERAEKCKIALQDSIRTIQNLKKQVSSLKGKVSRLERKAKSN